MHLTPGILTDSFVTLQSNVEAIRYSQLIEAVHIDVIDGTLVDNLTVTPLDLTVADFEPLKIDFHLLVEEPMDYVYECAGVKDYLPIRRVIGQIERMSYQSDFLQEVKVQGWTPALALDLFTPIDAIDDDVWPDLTHILLMATEYGHSGHAMNFHILEKIQQLRQAFPDPKRLHIMVDGGIKPENVQAVLSAGADEVVATSAIWDAKDPLVAIEQFHKMATHHSN